VYVKWYNKTPPGFNQSAWGQQEPRNQCNAEKAQGAVQSTTTFPSNTRTRHCLSPSLHLVKTLEGYLILFEHNAAYTLHPSARIVCMFKLIANKSDDLRGRNMGVGRPPRPVWGAGYCQDMQGVQACIESSPARQCLRVNWFSETAHPKRPQRRGLLSVKSN